MYNKNMDSIIYAHRNKLNNKYYIGQTIQEPSKRWRCGEGYVHCQKFYNAIKKYGWNNFEHIILCKCNSSDADTLEKYYIKKYDSVKNGYNISFGGNTPRHLLEETKKKISEKRLKMNLKGKVMKNPPKNILGQKYISKYPNTQTYRVRIFAYRISKNFKTLEEAIVFRDTTLKEKGVS